MKKTFIALQCIFASILFNAVFGQIGSTASQSPFSKNGGVVGNGPIKEFDNLGTKSVLSINDDNVPTSIKSKIYNSANIINTTNIDYNKTGKTLIIRFATTDLPINTALTNKVIENEFFATGIGSINDFFKENSWGQFSLQNAGIVDATGLTKTFDQYSFDAQGKRQNEGDATKSFELSRDICKNTNIDWQSFDLNHDGQITPNELQIIFIISDGRTGATRGSTFSFSTPKGNITIRNRFNYLSCKKNDDPDKTAGILSYNATNNWHELSHSFFGTPDRYAGYCGQGNTGSYDIMGNNCIRTHMNIYDKMLIGWIRPKIYYRNFTPGGQPYGVNIESNTRLNLPAIESQPTALVCWAGGNEFFIMENRNKQSSKWAFDNGIPDEGIAIWWVNMQTGEIHLIDANNVNQKPDTYKNQGAGALFKNSNSSAPIFILPFNGVIAFGIKNISTVDKTMFFTFN